MIILCLVVLGLVMGSFASAYVWRLRKRETARGSKVAAKYTMSRGRSMCPHCQHRLFAKDLVPLLSWLSLAGKCRYCQSSIGAQYPLTELVVSLLFVTSYLFWPFGFTPIGWGLFVLWLVLVEIGVILAVYDMRWTELPFRIVRPFTAVTVVFVGVRAYVQADFWSIGYALLAAAILFGLFWAIHVGSKGEWIGGGDVVLAPALGLLAGTPLVVLLLLFIASFCGVIVALPGVLARHRSLVSKIPFGPFLLIATWVVVLWGERLITWYQNTLLLS